MHFCTSFASIVFYSHLFILFYFDLRFILLDAVVRTTASSPWLVVTTAATSSADAETFEYSEEEEGSYYYYYEDESGGSTKNGPNSNPGSLKAKPAPHTTSSGDTVADATNADTITASARTVADGASVVSGFTRKPREDDSDITNVIPLWDEPFLFDVKTNYGCILYDEKVQLDNELFGFEVEVSDQEKLKQERMMRIRSDREREWNRKESAKLPGQQHVAANDNDASSSGSGGVVGDGDGGSPPELDGDGNPVARPEKKASDTVEVSSGQALGGDCHSLLCASCHIVVEEFAQALAHTSRAVVSAGAAMAAAAPLHVEDVFRREFCASKPFTHRFSDLVSEVCRKFDDALGGSRPLPTKIADPRLQHLAAKFNKIREGYGYGEILFGHFERSLDSKNGFASWADRAVSPGFLADSKKRICRTMGACNATDFSAVQTKTRQERWTPQCHVCQALATDVEVRLQLLRRLESEGEVAGIIRGTCERLALTPEYDSLCRQILAAMAAEPGGARSLDEVAWMAKLHGESLTAKRDRNALARNSIKIGKGKGFYPDKLCETLGVCERWETPAVMEKKRLIQEVDAVFF